jgi:mannonate dehydratase
MNRRRFITRSSAAAAAAAAIGNGFSAVAGAAAGQANGRKRALMKVGASSANAYDANSLNACLRYGVKNITASPRIADGRLYATVEELKQFRDLPDKMGVSIDILTPPNLASSHIDRERNPGIMLGKSPERDREIEGVQTMIKNCAAAGIPCIKYNMSILGVLRTGSKPGRGDSVYTHFKLADAKADPPLTKAGRVTEDAYWERITYFLERVVPVATEYKVRIACHPNDSMTPPEGYQGVNAVLSTPEGLKKFVQIKESPYHGLNLCIGTLSEMLMDPGKEVFDHIRWFGTRRKIFNIHFRNIKGNRLEFSEVAPDEGSIDFAKVMMTFKEVGYDGMVQPDHTVRTTVDAARGGRGGPGAPVPPGAEGPQGGRGRGGDEEGGGGAGTFNPYTAFVYGYIRALIQATDLVNS